MSEEMETAAEVQEPVAEEVTEEAAETAEAPAIEEPVSEPPMELSEPVAEVVAEPAIEAAANEADETADEAVEEIKVPERVIIPGPPPVTDEISYNAVEKEGSVTAIWEMQGPKHLRTINPRSAEGKQILALFETS